jgi:hypothetical protein
MLSATAIRTERQLVTFSSTKKNCIANALGDNMPGGFASAVEAALTSVGIQID